jgi:acyl-CoA thioesterase FadM
MNTIVNKKNTKQDIFFRIRKRDINTNGEIYPHLLIEKLENAILEPVEVLENNYGVTAKRSSCVYKVDIIGKAYTGDELKIHTQLGKFDSKIAIFHIQITKNDKRGKLTTICKASFSYKLESNLAIQKIAS